MIELSHPLVQDYLRAARERGADSQLARIMLNDRMQDAGVHGGVGTPGGLDLATCCWWYANGEDEDEPALREALATVDELLGGGGRAYLVRQSAENPQVYVQALSNDLTFQHHMYGLGFDLFLGNPQQAPNLDHPAVKQAEKNARAVSLRDLRRRVLALYPEVVYERLLRRYLSHLQAEVAPHIAREAAAEIRSGDWPSHAPVECTYDPRERVVTWRSRIAAPQLIRPEQALNPAAFQGPFDAEMDEHLARTLRRTRMIEWATRTTDR